MTIWVYGDSYCTEDDVDYNWFKQISSITRQTVIAKGVRGCSNNWIAQSIAQQSNKHKQGDWIIMVQTQEDRQWFWEDKPEACNWQNHADPVGVLGISRQEHAAAKQWLTHLYNRQDVAWTTFTNSTWLAAYTIPRGMRYLVIPGFVNSIEPYNSFISVRGTLTEFVSYREFPDRASYQAALRSPRGDARANHLSPNNHAILARKISDCVLGQSGELDLTQGFEIVKKEFTAEDYE